MRTRTSISLDDDAMKKLIELVGTQFLTRSAYICQLIREEYERTFPDK